MTNKIRLGAAALLALFFGFTATALAATAVAPEDGNLIEMLRPIFDAFMRGEKLYAGMLALVFVVALVKRYAPKQWGIRAFVQGDVGGSLTTVVGSFAGAMATALASGAGASWAMAKTASLIAVGAAGGYNLAKKLLVPLLKRVAAKAPAWTQPIFTMVFWLFDKPNPVATAEASGQAAVDAKPATGVATVVSKPTEVE